MKIDMFIYSFLLYFLMPSDKELSEQLKEALKGGTHNLRDVLEELGLNKIKSRNGTEELCIDMKTNKLYVCGAKKNKILSYHEPLRMKDVGFISYTAEAEGGNIAGIFVGKYDDIITFLNLYKQLKE